MTLRLRSSSVSYDSICGPAVNAARHIRREPYLVLTASAGPEILAFDTTHLSQFGIWHLNTDEVCERVRLRMPVNARANDLSWQDEWNGDDPWAFGGRREGVDEFLIW